MNRSVLSWIIVVLLTCTSLAQEKGKEPKPAKTFLSALKAGQSVAVKDNAGRYEITLMESPRGDIRLGGYKVTEVGSDYIVVEDISGVTELRIPIYSIKSIIRHQFGPR